MNLYLLAKSGLLVFQVRRTLLEFGWWVEDTVPALLLLLSNRQI